MTGDQLVQDYLQRLDAAASDLPPDRRTDLLDGIREHVEGAREAGAAADEAAVRTLLDRLGAPEEVAAAAREQEGAPGWPAAGAAGRYAGPYGPPVQTVARPRGTGLELAAVLMLTLGSLVPLLGWAVGAVLLLLSRLWRPWEKAVGLLVWPGGLFGLLVFGGALVARTGLGGEECTTVGDTTTCSLTGTSLTPLPLLAAVLPPVVVAALLYRTARRRAAAEPPEVVHVVPGASATPWGGTEVAGLLLLGLGGLLLPVLLPLVGLALVLGSPRWSRRSKAVGVLLALAPLLLVLSGLLAGYLGNQLVGVGPVGLGLGLGYLGLLVGPALAAVWFAVRRPQAPTAG